MRAEVVDWNRFLLLLGAALIAIAIVGAQLIPHYQIADGGSGAGSTFAWRVNTLTGEVQMCAFSKNPFAQYSPDAAERDKMTINCRNGL